MTRLRYNNQAGTLASLPLSSGGTTVTFSVAPDFATITSPDYIPLLLDYGTANYEIVYLTAYTSSGTTGTITRAAEDATNWPAVAHNSTSGPGGGTAVWCVAPTILDFAGLPVVRHFPFAYNSSGISSGGYAVYTPNVGDILLDAWIEIDTAWNGTTPFGDIGWASSTAGLFALTAGNLVSMLHADTNYISDEASGYGSSSLSSAQILGNVKVGLEASGASSPYSLSGVVTPFLDSAPRTVPLKFVTANSLYIWVTQNGLSNGSSPSASQGSGVLYLVTSTPA